MKFKTLLGVDWWIFRLELDFWLKNQNKVEYRLLTFKKSEKEQKVDNNKTLFQIGFKNTHLGGEWIQILTNFGLTSGDGTNCVGGAVIFHGTL